MAAPSATSTHTHGMDFTRDLNLGNWTCVNDRRHARVALLNRRPAVRDLLRKPTPRKTSIASQLRIHHPSPRPQKLQTRPPFLFQPSRKCNSGSMTAL